MHVPIGGRWRIVQNCRVFRSRDRTQTSRGYPENTAQVSYKMAPSNQVWLDVRRLRDESAAQRLQRGTCGKSRILNVSDDPERLWTYFKTKVLKVSESCLRTSGTFGTSENFLTKETLNIIEENHRARLEARTGQYRELEREAVREEGQRVVRRDKEAQVRGVCETVKSHLWSTDSRPSNRRIRTFRSSKPAPRCFTVKAADGTTVTGKSEIQTRWAGYLRSCIVWTPRP